MDRVGAVGYIVVFVIALFVVAYADPDEDRFLTVFARMVLFLSGVWLLIHFIRYMVDRTA